MATNRTLKTHSLHHQAVQQHFNIKPGTYEARATKGIPGLCVAHGNEVYQVETLADRLRICEDQLASVGDASLIPLHAGILLEGMEFVPNFFDCVLDVLDELDQPRRYHEAKSNLALALSVAQFTGTDLWEQMSNVDADLLAACLVAATRINGGSERGRLIDELAGLYATHGQELLCQFQEGLYAHFPFAGTEVFIYEVVD